MAIPNERALEAYRIMHKIRHFEKQASRSFKEGIVQGFVHLCIGQEAVAAGLNMNLTDKDYLMTTHRGHGQALAKGVDVNKMMAELCGRETGFNRGKGGSMHVCDPSSGHLGAQAIVGGAYTLACGAAMAAQMQKTGGISVAVSGDGSTAEGNFHEGLNLAAVWNLPVLFVIENNGYGISAASRRGSDYTNPSLHTKTLADRALGYDMKAMIVDGNNVNEVYDACKEAVEYVRSGKGPLLMEMVTYRWDTHFVGDIDTYRAPEELVIWKEKDPIRLYEVYLKWAGLADDDKLKEIEKDAQEEVKAALQFAIDSPFPKPEEACEDVFTDIVEEGR